MLELLETRWNPSGLAPTAVNDTFSGSPGHPVYGTLLGNDSDPEHDALTAAMVSGPAHGIGSVDMYGNFSYYPNAGFTGTDTVTYKINDGTGDSNIATVTVTIAAPVAVGGTFSVHQGRIKNDLDLLGGAGSLTVTRKRSRAELTALSR